MKTIDPRLVVEDRFVPSQADWRESLFTTGNGYLMTRGAFEEHRPGETRATFINGGFVTPPGEIPLLGAVPDWTDLGFTVDGEPFDIQHQRPSGYRRVLDTDSGVITRTVLWRGAHTGTVRVTFRRVLPLDRPHLAAMEVTFEALVGDVLIECQTGIDAGIPSPSIPVWVPEDVAPTGPAGGTGTYHSIDGIHRLDLRWRVDTEIPLTYAQDAVHPRVRGVVPLAEGDRVTLTKYVSYRLERDGEVDVGLPAPGTDFAAVGDSSRAAWAKRWRASAIAVDGDPEAELAFRFAAFQLIGAATPNDPGAGMGARIGGFGYRHHVFWDVDIFVAPYFAVCQPDLARAHLAYRHRGLEGARRKAARYGRTGAFYAWESARTGDEVTPEWSNPLYGEPVRIWTGEIEEHITSDVAWSAHHYWRWSGDDAFLLDEGAEMIVEGARYWMSRLEQETDGLHLRDVIGPDEYHIHVDDNFYTNLLAAWQLRLVPEVISRLERIRAGSGEALLGRLGISSDDLAAFVEAADRTVLRRRADGVWEQHAGFFDLDTIDLATFEPRLHSLYDLLGEERMQRTGVIKQPDVLMAMTLLPDESDRAASGRANWEYYEPKADHGSSLSLAFHALLAAQMGEPDLGYSLFRRAAAIDLDDAMGNGAHGIHTACQGGMLMTGLFGFAGLRLEDGEPITEPRLPDHWKSIGITFHHRGRAYDVEVSR